MQLRFKNKNSKTNTQKDNEMSYEEVAVIDPSAQAAEAVVPPEMARRIDAITDLAAQAGAWTAQNGPAISTKEVNGQKVESHKGLGLVDFKDYAARHMPGADKRDVDVNAALLQAHIHRYLDPDAFKDTPAISAEAMGHLVDEGRITSTAIFYPTDVIRYSVHMIKQTGVPFEGSETEQRIGGAIDATFAALGYSPDNPAILSTKQGILETV
jgi:hypothetical protein